MAAAAATAATAAAAAAATFGRFVTVLVVLELLRGGDADPAVATIAALLPRVAATPVFVIVLLVCPPLALLALLLTSIVLLLLPLGRPVESEGLDEGTDCGSTRRRCRTTATTAKWCMPTRVNRSR